MTKIDAVDRPNNSKFDDKVKLQTWNLVHIKDPLK